MVRAYLNVRATGGAVKPLPWRGPRGLGLRLKSLLMKKGLGLMEDLMKEGSCVPLVASGKAERDGWRKSGLLP